jgi:hypothetical protein
MRRTLGAIVGLLTLGACTTAGLAPAGGAASVEIHLLAINDFHGNLEPPSGGVDLQLRRPDHNLRRRWRSSLPPPSPS